MSEQLELSREQVLAHRRRAGALEARLPRTDDSLHRAAWAGLTDSTPRAAVLSLHARVEGATPSDWQHPALVQLWGPRFSAYVVHARDLAVFSLGRLPADENRRRYAQDLADRLESALDGREVPYGEAGRTVGVHHNQLRYAATTGRVLIRWDGARQPTVRTVPAPEVDPAEARRELARRYLHVLGPGTVAGFARWAGVYARTAGPAFADLRPELTPVSTPVGDGWVLAQDEESFRRDSQPSPSVRLLPSGDSFWLLHGTERQLLVPDAAHRAELWTSRVWPGAVLLDGAVVGTWRRADQTVTVSPWGRLPTGARTAVEEEAATLPLPGPTEGVRVRWDPPANDLR